MYPHEVKVPDIGDFEDVEVIEILVKPGDRVSPEDPLITLESDKASMDVPSPGAGIVREINVTSGDRVSEGDTILLFDTEADPIDASANVQAPMHSETESPVQAPADAQSTSLTSAAGTADLECDVLVLGSGPGGYTAAFRAADLGNAVVLVERYGVLGGVCLNVGCIPSKALLHAAKIIAEASEMRSHGIEFGTPKINLRQLSAWKDQVVGKLTQGLSGMAGKRKVKIVTGTGTLADPHHLLVQDDDGKMTMIRFKHAIIAAGSEAVKLPFLPDDPRVFDSTGALKLNVIPNHLLVIGGGIIGLEMATVYHALGSKISVVEMLDGLIPGVDRDIVRPLHQRISKQYENIWLETSVTKVESLKRGLRVHFEGKNAPKKTQIFDSILCAVGRAPNGHKIGAEQAGVGVDARGFIPTDFRMRTNIDHIFAIGDIAGEPMLAHKATHEGKVAAEAASGLKSHFDARTIPSVAYTDPEIAWAGISETEAKQKDLPYGKGTFPWAASGRNLTLGRSEGLTKLLFEEDTRRVIGIGIAGANAGDLIAEGTLAIEMGADAVDLGATIHPHPTLSETIGFAAEVFEGTITDLYLPKSRKPNQSDL